MGILKMNNINHIFHAGTGKVDITPPLTIPYLGFSPRHSFFKGVHDRLYATALVIHDDEKEVCLVAIDSIGFFSKLSENVEDFNKELKEMIHKEAGVLPDAIMLTSAHIHSSPETLGFRPLDDHPGTSKWLFDLKTAICNAVKIAKENVSDVYIKCGKGNISGISYNRRKDLCLDDEVTVLLLESLDRSSKNLIVNFACHPVIVQVQDQVSADFVGAMREVLYKEIPGVNECLFIQGACGDINPTGNDSRDFRDVHEKGHALAMKVKDISKIISDPSFPGLRTGINYLSEQIVLPSRTIPTMEEYLLSCREKNISPSQEAVLRIEEGSGSYSGEIQMIQIGNVVFTGIPGEPVCSMGMEIKRVFAPLIGIPSGYANGYLGYILPDESLEKGGYEAVLGPWSKVGGHAYDIILEKIREMALDLIK